ncbi:MAG: hypothetical protein COU51_03950 [Parcubacteria group bacterium CG10_big_fil_rev_8_21_14_0_10_36_14]|nr:MAG: hypothetical protein COU51_03950 [Parcubacteria group bacterium CG10_big_fil_rev_8_21_14_0_10_36_14]
MFKDSDLVISETANIMEAMEAINSNQKGAAFIVDSNDTLLGVVSDGDIRRALLQGAILISPIVKIMNINCISIDRDGDALLVEQVFVANPQITILPDIDQSRKLKNIYYKDSKNDKILSII